MSENQPPYYSIFHKNWRPKPKEPPKERKRKLKTSDNAEKQVKVELVPEVSEVTPENEILGDLEVTSMETEEIPCNWDNLPNELKLMCIKRTDFKTRANLMLSNRHNKMLVESIKSKHPLRFVRFFGISFIELERNKYEFAVKSWRSTADYSKSGSCFLELGQRKLMDVLFNANIDELDLETGGYSHEIGFELFKLFFKTIENKQLSVKSLRIGLTLYNSFELEVLGACDEHLEHITVAIGQFYQPCHLEGILESPQVENAKKLTFCEKNEKRQNHREKAEIVVDWMLFDGEVDHNIGKEVIMEKGRVLWEWFVAKVEEKIAFRHPTEKMLCLRLQNAEKHVWAWLAEPNGSLNFLVVASGSDAPNVKEIQKQRAKERKEYLLKTRL